MIWIILAVAFFGPMIFLKQMLDGGKMVRDYVDNGPNYAKKCSCGKKYTLEEFRCLDMVGIAKDDPILFEQRNCPCGSTIGIHITYMGELTSHPADAIDGLGEEARRLFDIH